VSSSAALLMRMLELAIALAPDLVLATSELVGRVTKPMAPCNRTVL
jgi:hypothetical protein